MRGFAIGLIIGAAAGAAAAYMVVRDRLEPDVALLEGAVIASPDSVTTARSDRKGNKRRGKRRKGKGGAAEPAFVGDVIPELSAADRQLIWRGSAVRLPAKSVDFESGSEGRSLNSSEISAGIASQRGAIVRCIGDARGNAEMSARITVKFLVGANGGPTKSQTKAPRYLHKRGLHRCISRAVRSMRFSATGAATVVTVPFDLS